MTAIDSVFKVCYVVVTQDFNILMAKKIKNVDRVKFKVGCLSIVVWAIQKDMWLRATHRQHTTRVKTFVGQ